jgi:hypothetical protein
MATKAQKAHALNSYFAKKYKKTVGRQYEGNTFRDKWGFQDMIDDLGEEDARKVIDWYFQTARDPDDFSAIDLHRNYDRLNDARLEYIEDMQRIFEHMQQTKKKVEEYRRRPRGFN